MSRRPVSALDASALPQRRSWFKTAVAFIPFLTLVVSAWVYAFHLHNLANQSMVHPKEKARSSTGAETDKSPSPATAAGKDNIVIGDSKDKIFYFVQVTRQERKKKNGGDLKKGCHTQQERGERMLVIHNTIVKKKLLFLQGVMLARDPSFFTDPAHVLLLFCFCFSISLGF
jgi:hypothetical protein